MSEQNQIMVGELTVGHIGHLVKPALSSGHITARLGAVLHYEAQGHMQDRATRRTRITLVIGGEEVAFDLAPNQGIEIKD